MTENIEIIENSGRKSNILAKYAVPFAGYALLIAVVGMILNHVNTVHQRLLIDLGVVSETLKQTNRNAIDLALRTNDLALRTTEFTVMQFSKVDNALHETIKTVSDLRSNTAINFLKLDQDGENQASILRVLAEANGEEAKILIKYYKRSMPHFPLISAKSSSKTAVAVSRDGKAEVDIREYIASKTGQEFYEIDEPDYSSDGLVISFVSRASIVDTDPSDDDNEIFVFDIVKNEIRQVTVNEVDDEYPRWNPVEHSRTILYHSFRKRVPHGVNNKARKLFSIMSINADGGAYEPKTLITSEKDESFILASWSPGGKRIAFTKVDEKNSWHLYLANSDGSDTTRITSAGRQGCQNAWHPSGRYIAYTLHHSEIEGSAVKSIALIDLEDGNKTYVLMGDETKDSAPSWSPDGRYIVYSSSNRAIRIADDGEHVFTEDTKEPKSKREESARLVIAAIEFQEEGPVATIIATLPDPEIAEGHQYFYPRWKPFGGKSN